MKEALNLENTNQTRKSWCKKVKVWL